MSDNDYFSRKNRLARRARRLAEFDSLTGINHKAKGKLTTQNAGQHAVSMARDLLNNFRMPSFPKLSYSGIRNARTAQSSSKLEDGVVTIFAEIRTISGVNVGFDIPMEIRDGELMEPSVVVVDGAPRIIAQSTFDDLVERSTMYDLPPVREMYSAPVQQNQAAEAYGNRTKMKRVNTGLFSLGAARQALKDAVAGRSITAQMEAAGPDEDAMNLRINDLSHKMDFGMGSKDQHMQELQKLVKQREQLRNTLQPKGKGPHEADEQTAQRSPLAPAQTPGSTYGVGGHQITQPMPGLKKKLSPGQAPGYSQNTDVTQVDTSLPTAIEDTSVRTQPEDRTRNLSQKPEQTKVSPPRAAGVEDYDADDKHEKPDHDRNHQDDDWLDPAERYHQHDLHVGQEVSLKEALEVKERGGAVYDLPKGTKCKILRDHAGDNKSFVVRFEDESLEAIVERCFLAKSAAMVRTAAERQGDMTLVNTGYIVDHPLADIPGVSLCGGAIRDFIRGRQPKDYDYFFDDIATHKACIDMFVKDGGEVIDGSEMATRVLHNGDMYELVHGRIFASLEETLDSFDITACMFGTKGREVWATQIGLDDLNAAVIRPWNIWHLPITHLRIAKLCDIHGFRDPFGVRDAVARRATELGFDLTAQVATPTPYELSIGITAGSVIANRTMSAIAHSMTPWQEQRGIEPSSAVHPMFMNGFPVPQLDPVTGRYRWGNGPGSCVAPPDPGRIHVQMTPGGPISCQYAGCQGSCVNPNYKSPAQVAKDQASGMVSGVMPEPTDVIDMPQQTMGKAWAESQIIAKMREYKNSLKMPMDQAVQKIIQDGASGTPTPAPDEVKYLQSIYKSANKTAQMAGQVFVLVPTGNQDPGAEMAVLAESANEAVMAVINGSPDWTDVPDDWYNSDIPVQKGRMGGFDVYGPYDRQDASRELLSEHESKITPVPNEDADGAILPPEKGMPLQDLEASPKVPKKQQPTKIPKKKRSPSQKVKRNLHPDKHGDADVTYHNMQERDMAGGLSEDGNFIAKVNEEVGGMRDQGLSDVDIKHAVFTKYGPEVAEKVFA